jgi:hypothetical protein
LTDQGVARQITGWVAALSGYDAGRDGPRRSGTISLSGDDAGRDGPRRSGTISLNGNGVESAAEISEHLD